MALSTEDRLELHDLMGRYCHMVDSGDESWADLFLADGVLSGIMPEPVIGHAALREIPGLTLQLHQGKCRHHLTSITIDDAGDGQARFRAYNLVTDWQDGGKLVLNACYDIDAVKTGAGWKLRTVSVKTDR